MHGPMDEVAKEAGGVVVDLQCDVGEYEEWGFGCMRVRVGTCCVRRLHLFTYLYGGRMPFFVNGRQEERRVY